MRKPPGWRIAIHGDWDDADRASKMLDAAGIRHTMVPPDSGSSRPFEEEE